MEVPELIKPLIERRVLELFFFSITLLVLGMVAKNYAGISGYLIFPEGISTILIAILVFAVGFLFFGYLSPLMMFFVGIYVREISSSTGLVSMEPLIIISSAALITYSAIMLGDSLLKDMAGRGNFLRVLKVSAVIFAVGIALAGVGEFLLI